MFNFMYQNHRTRTFSKWFVLKGLPLSYKFGYFLSLKEQQEVHILLTGGWREGLHRLGKKWLVVKINGNDTNISYHTTRDAVFWHTGPCDIQYLHHKLCVTTTAGLKDQTQICMFQNQQTNAVHQSQWYITLQ